MPNESRSDVGYTPYLSRNKGVDLYIDQCADQAVCIGFGFWSILVYNR